MQTQSTVLWIMLSIMASQAVAESQVDLTKKAKEQGVNLAVLQDFVQSYDFKCPEAITEQQLDQQLAALDEESDLAIMLEANRMDWRDLYVESRSQIQCMTGGKVSKGY